MLAGMRKYRRGAAHDSHSHRRAGARAPLAMESGAAHGGLERDPHRPHLSSFVNPTAIDIDAYLR